MSRKRKNILFAHSGGVTSVVNTVAHTIYQCTKSDNRKLYISQYGVDGLMNGNFTLASDISDETWHQINQTPGSSFGSSRKRIPQDKQKLETMFSYLDKHDIGIFFCNGGNNSQCITKAIQIAADEFGYPLQCIGIPKTIDNDIFFTDTCPGFGSVAKYTATSVYEMSLDLASMCHSSTQVLIYEAMGRSTGWIAASSALAKDNHITSPHIILMPEAKFSLNSVIQQTKACIAENKHCVIVLAEGINDIDGLFNQNFTQYQYKSLYLSYLIRSQLSVKCHTVIPDYMQRSARHLVSKTDIEQTIALSQHAYQLAQSGKNGIMVTIQREQDLPYTWSVSHTALDEIAGRERVLPNTFISSDQLYVTQQCINYVKPLIQGELYPNYINGVPDYSHFIYNYVKQ